MKKLSLLVCGVAGLAACSEQDTATPVYHADENPALLSEWGQVTAVAGKLKLTESVLPYDLNTPLFSDYAHKLRTVWMPEGHATYDVADVFDFPIGTVITKTFYYPLEDDGNSVALEAAPTDRLAGDTLDLQNIQLLETRILVRRPSGWSALPYVWNEDQTDATLKRTGDLKQLVYTDDNGVSKEFHYVVPDANQCAGCHATNNTTREIKPIGPKARHLNREFAYTSGSANQLEHWMAVGMLKGAPNSVEAPALVNWQDTNNSVDDRARAYLDINCSHCHNKVGPADTSGLLLEASDTVGASYGICKPPIAAGTGTGGRLFDIVPGQPEASIFSYRMASTNPSEMMPELGRALAHKEGVALINQWIEEMPGGCD